MEEKSRPSVEGKGVFSPQTFTLSNGSEIQSKFPVGTYIGIGLLIVAIIAMIVTGVDIAIMIRNGSNFWGFIGRMFPPNWTYFEKAVGPMIDTIQMSLFGSFIGSVAALPIAFLAASNITKNKIVLGTTRFILTIFRTLPVLVYASVLVLVFGLGTFAGTLAIMMFTFSIVSKILYENIETIDLGAFEAIQSTGADRTRAIIVAIIPQILPSFFSTSLYAFEINIRYAAILGYVGAGGIGYLISERLGWRLYDDFGMIFILLFIVVMGIESLSRYLRGRLE